MELAGLEWFYAEQPLHQPFCDREWITVHNRLRSPLARRPLNPPVLTQRSGVCSRLILGYLRGVSREARSCCVGIELKRVMQSAQLICHVRQPRADVEETPAENLAWVVFRAEPAFGLLGGGGQTKPPPLRFDQAPSQIFMPDPVLEEARIDMDPVIGSDESVQRLVADSVGLA